jgi:hypothetical protein
MKRRDWSALAQAILVFLAILAYIWWLRWHWGWSWTAPLAFVILTHFLRREGPRALGFGRTGLGRAARAVLPAAAAVALGTIAAGAAFGTLRPKRPGAVALDLLGYFAWGLFQQYVLNAFFVNRLEQFDARRAVPIAAALFSLAHLPNWFLMAVTLAGGYALAKVYVRYRSLYPLAIAHGIVAYALYLAVPDSVSAHFLVGPRYLQEGSS